MTKYLVLIPFFAFTALSFPQSANDGNPQSVVFFPGYTEISPQGTVSTDDITDGFENFRLGIDFGEPYIATNPRNQLNNICAFNINNLYYTLDGHNWVKNNPSFPGFSILGDPVMCYDSIGTAFYMQLYQNGNVYGITVVKSSNGGVSWSTPFNVFSTTVGLADKEWITADQTGGPFGNYVYAGWRQFGSSGMRFVRSTNGGVNWSSPLTFSGGQGAYVSVGPNGPVQGGSVYFAALGNSVILVNRSTDGGATFSAQVNAVTGIIGPGIICAGRNTVKGCIRTDAFPRMTADNSYTSSRGNVYVVYADNSPGPDNADIFFARSTNFGVNWSAPLRVNDDNTTTDQWMPSISVDRTTGRVFICWYDSRMDPANNLMTRLYGAISTNGGVSFTPNSNISDVSFNPDNMRVSQPGGHYYIGDYIGISAIGNTSYSVWMDGRNNNLGSFTAYYPDFALTVSHTFQNLSSNDSVLITAAIPAVKGPYSGNVKFTAALDSLPTSGSISITFQNGKDSVVSFPDSVKIKVKTSGNVNARLFKLTIKGFGSAMGVPVHSRIVNLLVNSSYVTVGTNRPGIADFKVNGVQYNQTQQFVFPNSSVVTLQALSPKIVGSYKYIFLNWSDNGDTTHNITVNGNVTITANYKVQYKLIMSSLVGNTFAGNEFYDSSQSVTFGVLSRYFTFNGQPYQFRGWTGTGNGSYTSADSTGNDTAVTVSMFNPISETARWTSPIGIVPISTEIPKEYKLYQNFPNPFNPSTVINFDIIKPGNVKIYLYDLLGRQAGLLLNEELNPGRYSLTFNAGHLASGMYIYKIVSGNFVDVKKMLLLK